MNTSAKAHNLNNPGLETRLLDGLQRIQASQLDLSLVPLDGKKRPLGDEWQNRPMTAVQLIQAIKNGGVEVPIKGEIRKIPLSGFGLITCRPITINNVTYYVMALDRDGASATPLIEKLTNGEGIPKTVAFTSGRTGRCQYLLLVPEQYKDLIRYKKIKTGVKGDDGKDEALEFRWSNQQSVLPPSVHPLTGGYRYLDGCGIDEIEIAIAPNWVISQMLVEDNYQAKLIRLALRYEVPIKWDGERIHKETIDAINKKANIVEIVQEHVALKKRGKDFTGICPFHSDLGTSFTVNPARNDYYCYGCSNGGSVVRFLGELEGVIRSKQFNQKPTGNRARGMGNGENYPTRQKWTDEDFALSYLEALSPSRADDYQDWVAVGMALKSISDDLLSAWESWSQHSPKYKFGECTKKWRSFKSNGVSLGTLAHMAKQDGWEFPFKKKENPHLDRSTVKSDTTFSFDNAKLELLSLSDTVTAVTNILKLKLKDYEERDRLDNIQANSTVSKAAFWEMVAAARCDLEEVQPEDENRVNQLVDWHGATLDLKKLLPHQLADAFHHDASVLNIDPVSLWQYFLPAILSLAGKKINLDVDSHIVPAIAWTCIVAESGTGKTRAEKVILSPLKKLQYRERSRYLSELQDYKEVLSTAGKDSPKPTPPRSERKYLFEVATIQALMRRLAEQGENGSLWARDEVAGLFKSLGQFGKGKSEHEGLECLLKLWDGDGALVERMDAENDSYAVEETRLSIAGGIQPGAYQQAFKDPDDAQGLQARFLYAVTKVYQPQRVKGKCLLNDILPDLYDWLDRLPKGFLRLSPEADLRYTQLVEIFGQAAESSSTPAIRAWMRKLSTQLLRIAFGLHLIECYCNRSFDFWEIQRNTLDRALEFCRYYRSAFQVVQEKVAETDSISSILLKIWDKAVTSTNGVTPRDIYRHVKAIEKRAAALGRKVGAYTIDLLSKLVQMGKGKLEKDGRTFRFFALLNSKVTEVTEAEIPVEQADSLSTQQKMSLMTEVTEAEISVEQADSLSTQQKMSLMTEVTEAEISVEQADSLSAQQKVSSEKLTEERVPTFLHNDEADETATEANSTLKESKVELPNHSNIERQVDGNFDETFSFEVSSNLIPSHLVGEKENISQEQEESKRLKRTEPGTCEQTVDVLKKGDRVKSTITGTIGIIKSFNSDRTATLELDSGEIVKWYVYLLEKDIDISSVAECLASLPQNSDFLARLLSFSEATLKAAWEYIRHTRGSDAMKALYLSLKADYGDDPSIWGIASGLV